MMKTLATVAIAAAMFAAVAHAQSRPAPTGKGPASMPATRPIWMEEPDDRYSKLLAGKKLEDGKGFPGVVAIGDPLGDAMKQLGNGREDFNWTFWYFYDKAPW